ncbi:MAG: hypothetical protein NUV75_02120 [Gallionella sp.]|nr:hypothetical protein [Gallionella sp.]
MSGHRTEADYIAQVCDLADENTRLRAVNAELVEALNAAIDYAHPGMRADLADMSIVIGPDSAVAKIRAALANAEEK